MRTSAKLGLTALMAALLLASAVSTASARSFEINEQSFRITFTSLNLAASIVTIRCRVTLEGSFHTRGIFKSAGNLVGAITRAIVARPCTNGEAWTDNGSEAEPLGTAPNKLPFHVTYESFRGTLPRIESVRLLLSRVSFVISSTVLGMTCRGRYGNTTDNITGEAPLDASGGVTSLEAVTGRNIVSLVEQLGPAAICPGSGTFSGPGVVTVLNGGGRLVVRLI